MKKGEWLSPIYQNLLWRLELVTKEPSIDLNADMLWSESLGGGKINEKQGNTSRRLFEALRDHYRLIDQQHQSGKMELKKSIFTDVVVCLPSRVYHTALIEQGQARLNACLHNLAINHQNDFKASLPQNRAPRYLAQPDPNLADNSIVFLFGPSIYIPDIDEPAIGFSLHLNEQLVVLPDIECWYDRKEYTLPIRVYAGQEFLILAPEQHENAISISGRVALPSWQPNDSKEYLLIQRTAADRWKIYLNSRPYLPQNKAGKTWKFDISLNASQILAVDINTTSQPEATAYQPDIGKTIIFDSPHSISSCQLALQRICLPTYKNLAWTLWLDSKGRPASVTTIGRQHKLAYLSFDQNELSFTDEDESTTLIGNYVTRPRRITLSGGEIRLLPAPEGLPNCVGLLHLGVPEYYPIGEAYTTIGRFDPNNPDESPEIALDQLSQPGSISSGYPSGTTLNHLGLSRHHVQIRANNQKLEVKLVRDYNTFHQLNDDGKLIASREKSLEPLFLDNDHYLVVGNFIFLFQHK